MQVSQSISPHICVVYPVLYFSLERGKYNRTDLQTSDFWMTQLQLKGGVTWRIDLGLEPLAVTLVCRLLGGMHCLPWEAGIVPWHSSAVRCCARN